MIELGRLRLSDPMRPRVVIVRDGHELRPFILKPLEDDPDIWGTVAGPFPSIAAAKRELGDIRRRQYGIPRAER